MGSGPTKKAGGGCDRVLGPINGPCSGLKRTFKTAGKSN